MTLPIDLVLAVQGATLAVLGICVGIQAVRLRALRQRIEDVREHTIRYLVEEVKKVWDEWERKGGRRT